MSNRERVMPYHGLEPHRGSYRPTLYGMCRHRKSAPFGNALDASTNYILIDFGWAKVGIIFYYDCYALSYVPVSAVLTQI